MRHCSLIVAAGLLLSVARPSGAAEDRVSVAGNDVSTGTRAEPFRTITRAVQAVKPGDTVFVRAGRYEENVWIGTKKGGAPGKWVTLSAAPGDERKVVVGTEKPRVDAYGGGSSAFSLSKVQYVRLRGFKCLGIYRGRGSAIGVGRSQHIEILNCIVTGGGQGGVDANHCNYVTIDGVEAYFNGGGSGWSSGISLLDLTTKKNIVRNNICYGNYDDSSWRSDGNGIIIDNGYEKGGALVANNLCFMNGGKGISSTRSDDVVFLNNTLVANCWQTNQQPHAHELTVRGAKNVVRNNLCVATLPQGVGMMFLGRYSGPGGNVVIDPKTITCDHNLFFNTGNDLCVRVSGNRRNDLTLDQLKETKPQWSKGVLSVDPGFVDMKNHNYNLRADSPALKAGVADARAPTDVTGKPRPKVGAVSLGCYEGTYPRWKADMPAPGIVIASGENRADIEALLKNRYDFDWHGMLWGWGKLLPEEIPLHVEVVGPRKADFLNLSGTFVLKELLERIAREHQVRLVLRRPVDCKALPTTPHVISRRLSIRQKADVDERAFVRRMLRVRLWTEDPNGRNTLAEQLPALSAALGLKIESTPPVPKDRKVEMVTRNMKLACALTDLAERLDARFTLSRQDPMAEAGKVRPVTLGEPFGGPDGIVELTVDQPDGRGRVDVFARVHPGGTLCARVADRHSRFIAPPTLDSREGGPMFHKASTRLDRGSVVRLAVVGTGCALNVGNEWVLMNRVPATHAAGTFTVRVVSKWFKVSKVRYRPL